MLTLPPPACTALFCISAWHIYDYAIYITIAYPATARGGPPLWHGRQPELAHDQLLNLDGAELGNQWPDLSVGAAAA